MLVLVVYIPKSHLEQVKTALFDAGAGRIGDYDACCWQVEGTGQFRPLKGSQPYIGQRDVVTTVSEFRVEMVLAARLRAEVTAALLAAHPYEEPAYHFLTALQI